MFKGWQWACFIMTRLKVNLGDICSPLYHLLSLNKVLITGQLPNSISIEIQRAIPLYLNLRVAIINSIPQLWVCLIRRTNTLILAPLVLLSTLSASLPVFTLLLLVWVNRVSWRCVQPEALLQMSVMLKWVENSRFSCDACLPAEPITSAHLFDRWLVWDSRYGFWRLDSLLVDKVTGCLLVIAVNKACIVGLEPWLKPRVAGFHLRQLFLRRPLRETEPRPSCRVENVLSCTWRHPDFRQFLFTLSFALGH